MIPARSPGHTDIPAAGGASGFLTLISEWAGRGAELQNPYDRGLVQRAPRDIRHVLADALAEEATARELGQLGIAFTLWHDVATSADPDDKVDHVVLGPSGLYSLLSEDWGGPVRVRKGELVGETLEHGEHPFAISRASHPGDLARGAGAVRRPGDRGPG